MVRRQVQVLVHCNGQRHRYPTHATRSVPTSSPAPLLRTDAHVPDGDAPADRTFRIRLANRLTELRLAIDLGEIRTRAAFMAALERDGTFMADDPRVLKACSDARLAAWLTGPDVP